MVVIEGVEDAEAICEDLRQAMMDPEECQLTLFVISINLQVASTLRDLLRSDQHKKPWNIEINACHVPEEEDDRDEIISILAEAILENPNISAFKFLEYDNDELEEGRPSILRSLMQPREHGCYSSSGMKEILLLCFDYDENCIPQMRDWLCSMVSLDELCFRPTHGNPDEINTGLFVTRVLDGVQISAKMISLDFEIEYEHLSAFLEAIHSQRNLKDISISCVVDDSELETVEEIARFRSALANLVSSEERQVESIDFRIKFWTNFGGPPSWQNFKFQIPDCDWAPFFRTLASNTTLTSLKLINVKLEEEATLYLADCLAQNNHLRRFVISKVDTSEETLAALSNALETTNTTLEVFHLQEPTSLHYSSNSTPLEPLFGLVNRNWAGRHLIGQPVPVGLWPFILERINRCKNNKQDLTLQQRADAIYHMIRNGEEIIIQRYYGSG